MRNHPLKVLAALWMLLLPQLVVAQNTMIALDFIQGKHGDTLRLGNQRLTPGSAVLKLPSPEGMSELPEGSYELNEWEGYIILKDSNLDGQDIQVSYRYFPKFLQPGYAIRTQGMDDSASLPGITIIPEYFSREERYYEPTDLKKSGSISRGISVGNNQNLTVTSGLRLQVEGDLGDGMKIVAAITDENIPIQPDGTTQQIQDFDKVFIRLEKGNDNVVLGDFEITKRGTFFADFYRNVQGIGVEVRDGSFRATANGAVAKGKFNTNSFIGQDGVQGPYRLTGRNNERFIIVLAGSEKVFVNGAPMVRGEGNDYTIDYNTGELTFTAQQLITSASRIVIDFEYTDRFYNRSLLFAETEGKLLKDKFAFRVSYGRDADNQNAPIEGAFTEEQLDSLRAAGDNASGAFISGIDSTAATSSENVIRYERSDTTIGSVTYERYLYSKDPELAFYKITFSFVGMGNGFYVKDVSGVNGTVFEWVAPDSSGALRGDYAPIRALVLPKLLQVADLQMSYNLTKKVKFYSEQAVSIEDRNRLSPLQDNDNIDIANKTGVLIDGLRLADSVFLKLDVSQKYVGVRYTNLDRINKVEYGREWNFDDLGTRATERITEAIAELRIKKALKFTTNAGVRSMGTSLFSVKQLYKAESQWKVLQGNYTFTTITTQNRLTGLNSRWDRHNGDIYKRFWKLQPGTEIWMEDKRDAYGDSTANGSFRFLDFKPYIKTYKTEKLQAHLAYNYRKEYEQLDSLYTDKSEAHTGYAKVVYNPVNSLSFQNTSSVRDFRLIDERWLEKGLDNKRTVITNLQGSYFTKNKLVFANMIYEITSEQLARKEVAFIEVNPGQGQWEWIDDNEDGIQQLTEFYSSAYNPTSPANYIRVVIPTRTLFPTTSLDFSGNLKLEMKQLFQRSKNPFKETIRNFSTVTNFRVMQKKEEGNDFSNYLIQLNNVFGDTSLLEAQYTLRQDAYFFRNNSVGDIRFYFADSRSKQFLTTGNELRSLVTWGSDHRLNFDKSKSLENELKLGQKVSQAEMLTNRNYDIRFWEANPHFNLQFSRKLRFTLGYTVKNKVNSSDSLEVQSKVQIHKLSADSKINLKDRNNLFLKFEMARVSQSGESGFVADFEMRESLQPGNNFIWQVFLTYYLSQSLELSVTYDGRASEGNKVLHSGRVQIKAFF